MVAHPGGRDDEMDDKGKVCQALESFENLSDDHPNLELSDQSKSLKCVGRPPGKSSEILDGFADDVNEECLPVNNDKMDKKSEKCSFWKYYW